jgi:hypothetical protein
MTSPQVTRRNAWRRLPQALAKSAAAGFIAVAVSIGVCPDATAWGLTGHRVTAAIADKYLSFEARAAIREILETGESLAEAANFPDFMRSSDDPFWSKARPWHFVTVPKGKTYAEVRAPDGGDAFTALKSFSDTLKSQTSSLAEKRVALRFTVHIIGDLHQPLHNGNGLDSGGNDVKVKFFGADTSLHSVWDEGLIEQEKLSYTEWTDWLSAKITDDMARKWWNPDPLVWIAEATALRDKIYPANEELQFRYQFDHIATVREQLQKGGVRTAAYLNRLFSR